jgi:hypothetical protein
MSNIARAAISGSVSGKRATVCYPPVENGVVEAAYRPTPAAAKCIAIPIGQIGMAIALAEFQNAGPEFRTSQTELGCGEPELRSDDPEFGGREPNSEPANPNSRPPVRNSAGLDRNSDPLFRNSETVNPNCQMVVRNRCVASVIAAAPTH